MLDFLRKFQQLIAHQGDLDALSLQRALQMGFTLPKPKTLKNGGDLARQVIPADVRDEYQRLYGKRWEERWRAEPGTPSAERKRQYGEWIAEINRRFAAIRAANRGEGIDLSRKDALALAGEWYTWFVKRHEDAPGKPQLWEAELWSIIDAMMQHAPDEVRAEPMSNLEWTRATDVRAGIRPVLADLGYTAQFLASRGIALRNEARTLFLDCVLDNYIAALSLLEQRAKGDYSPDTTPQTFPKFEARRQKTTGRTAWQLFAEWVEAAQPRPSTINRWRAVFKELDKQFSDRSADAITPDEAQAWAEALVANGRTARTVSDIWITAARRVFSWAVKQRKIAGNPFADTNVTVPRRVRTRGPEFTNAEIQTILKASLAITDTRRPFKAACRWVPWLCAYSGARAGEVTQLRGRDVQAHNSFTVMHLTSEAGTMKTGAPRTVPIHAHVIEQGFLDYVKARGQGPLFYDPAPAQEEPGDPTNPRRERFVKQRERLAHWIRELGITDKQISPTHAWRHTFKRRAARADIEKRFRDAFCGHSTKDVGDQYETPTAEDMADALKQFPRYDIG
jgi:integrase